MLHREEGMSLLGVRAVHCFFMTGLVLLMGCRGSMPFGKTVQITKSSDAAEINIESPEQRLATSKSINAEQKSRGESVDTDEFGEQVQPLVDAGSQPEVEVAALSDSILDNQVLSESAELDDPSESMNQNEIALVHSETIDPAVDSDSQEVAQAKGGPVEVSSGSNPLVVSNRKSDEAEEDLALNLTDEMSAEELLAALNAFPPQKRAEAVQQFVQLVAEKAGATSQPNPLAGEIEKALSEEISLPESTDDAQSARPDRLARNGGEVEAESAEIDPLLFSFTDAAIDSEGEDQTVSVSQDPEIASAESASEAAELPDNAVAQEAKMKEAEAEPVAQVSVELPIAQPSSELSMPTMEGVSQAQLLAALIASLQKAPVDESELERHGRLVKLSHLMVLSGNPEAAIQSMDEMTPLERDFLRHQLQGLWQLIDPMGHPSPNRRFTSVASEFREAARRAGAATDSLEVRQLTFCTEIEAYGQVKAFDKTVFNAGQQVILYCEVDNFLASKMESGFELHLRGSYEIYDAENQRVFNQILPADRQISTNYLRDYFVAYQMFLPSELSSGSYRLKLTMEDLLGKKYGQADVWFEIQE
jgi:hypothetical protein